MKKAIMLTLVLIAPSAASASPVRPITPTTPTPVTATAPTSTVQTITVVNAAHVWKRALRRWERAEIVQARQVRRFWHTPLIRFGKGGWRILITNHPRIPADWGGEHFALPVIGAIVRRDAWTVGFGANPHHFYPEWEQTASHELVEMLADPSCVGTEIADPVEMFGYAIHGAAVTAFIKPNGKQYG